jgi:hypothetical protein
MFLAHQTLQFFTLHFPRSWLCRKPKRSRRPSGAKKGPVIGRQGAGNFSGELVEDWKKTDAPGIQKRSQNRCERAQQRSSVRVFDNFNDQKTANIQSRDVVNVLN